jgi:hypothetical protein
MAKAFIETEASAKAGALTHPEWLVLLLNPEIAYRSDKKRAARLRHADSHPGCGATCHKQG